MAQQQKSSTSTGFFSKIRDNYGSRISNLKPTSEKDGNTEQDTLINLAFIKYFDEKNLPYPDWLGVPQKQQQPGQATYTNTQSQYSSQYQPVQTSNHFNNSYYQQQAARNAQAINTPTQDNSNDDTGKILYQRRSSSRLEDMHNRSRQQSIPGSGYSSQAYQISPASNAGNNTSRLRERMLSQNPSSMYSGTQQSSTSRWNR